MARRISNWTAERVGGMITLVGVDVATGEPIKIVGIDTIKATGKPIHPVEIIRVGTQIVATDKDGLQHELIY